jgi:SAM-dependent methyltransferase
MDIGKYYRAQIENHSRAVPPEGADLKAIEAENSTNYWRHDRMRSTILPLLAAKERWITIGDGYGTDAAWLIAKGQAVHCTDIQDTIPKMCNLAGLIADYSAANAEAMSFGDEEFDWGLCKEAYHHMPRPPIAFYEMLRVVKKGLVLIEPGPRQAKNLWGSVMLGLLNRIRPVRLENHFEESGNYIFKLSIFDVQQMAMGIGLRCFAYKSINNFYVHGVEFERPPGALKRLCERKIFMLDLACDCMGLHKGLMIYVVFKRDPVAREQLERAGFQFVDLPSNPYLA